MRRSLGHLLFTLTVLSSLGLIVLLLHAASPPQTDSAPGAMPPHRPRGVLTDASRRRGTCSSLQTPAVPLPPFAAFAPYRVALNGDALAVGSDGASGHTFAIGDTPLSAYSNMVSDTTGTIVGVTSTNVIPQISSAVATSDIPDHRLAIASGYSVALIDTLTNAQVTYVSTQGEAVAAFDAAAHRFFVSSSQNNTVTMMDARTGRTLKVVALAGGSQPEALAADPVTHHLFVGNWFTKSMSMLDDQTGQVITTTAINSNPVGMDVDSDAHRLVILGSGPPLLFDTRTGRTVAAVASGQNALELVVDGPAHRAFVLNPFGHAVVVADTCTGRVVRTISSIRFPLSGAIDVAHNRAYILGEDLAGVYRTVTALDGSNGRPLGTIKIALNRDNGGMLDDQYTSFGWRPTLIAVDPVTGRVFAGISHGSALAVISPSPIKVLETANAYINYSDTPHNGMPIWRTMFTAITSPTALGLSRIRCSSVDECAAVGSAQIIVEGHHGMWSVTANGDTQQNLNGVSCPAPQTCYAAGSTGVIMKRTPTSRWTPLHSGTSQHLYAIACPSVQICYVTGINGTMLKTTDSGQTWIGIGGVTQHSLGSIACPTTTTCYASGDSQSLAVAVFYATHDGGKTWAAKPVPVSDTLGTVSCPGEYTCYLAQAPGVLLHTTDGGASWTSHNLGTWLSDLACASPVTCYVVSEKGSLLGTADGGRHWLSTPLPSEGQSGIACPTATTCYIIGDTGISYRIDSRWILS